MVLTAAERRMLLLVIGLLVLGTLDEMWHARSEARRIAAAQAAQASHASHASHGSHALLADGAAPSNPAAPAAPADTGAPPGEGGASLREARVDLNRATLAELDALPGVGPVMARRILDHRARYGPFRDPRDLRAVKGIGPKLYARLEPRVEIGPPAQGP